MNHIAFPTFHALSLTKSPNLLLNLSQAATLQCTFQGCGKAFKKRENFDRHLISHQKRPTQENISSLLFNESPKETSRDQNQLLQDLNINCKDEEGLLYAELAKEVSKNGTTQTECKLECRATTTSSDSPPQELNAYGKRAFPDFPFEDDEDDRLLKFALIENQALKKKLFVTRATVLAFYRQLVFLEGFMTNSKAI